MRMWVVIEMELLIRYARLMYSIGRYEFYDIELSYGYNVLSGVLMDLKDNWTAYGNI